ncbi:hypothetical protein [Ohtaekwangia sp.]|uniref:hypothetical protein n=1 Tax=Ohtaekwangia sp. TaxID=2066019 RepID=UPI002F923DD1
MKKLLIIATIICLASALANDVLAQERAKNRAGFLLAAASDDINEVGIGGIAEFVVAKRVTISPQMILYFPEDRGNYDINYLEINVNANYYFYNKDIFEFYGLGGLNFTRQHIHYEYNRSDYNNLEIGLNVGGGINFEVSKTVVPFSELRATIGDFNQIVVTGGLKFNLR